MNEVIELRPEDVLDSFSKGREVLVDEKQKIMVTTGSRIRHDNCTYQVDAVLQGRRRRILLKLSKVN